jgi:hypothetical protein
MYYLFQFRGETLIARKETFKSYYEKRGAECIRISDSFSELANFVTI